MDILEVFNKVEAHLLAQGVRSLNYNGACAYRGEGGVQCAVGCLIKDEFYHKDLEGLGMWMRNVQPRLRDALTASGITDINSRETRMLFDLQRLHDTFKPEDWEQELQELRVKYFGIDTSNTYDEKAAIDRHKN